MTKKNMIITSLTSGKSRVKKSNPIIGRKKIRKISAYKVFAFVTALIIVSTILVNIWGESLKLGENILSSAAAKMRSVKESKEISALKQVEIVTLNQLTYSQNELVEKVGSLIELPDEKISMTVKVKNAETLKRESDMYKDIKDNDYILLYTSKVIIYDADQNVIKNVVTLR